MTTPLPSRADVVVIGGGIAGLSALYHLALEGVTNTVLVERRQLACGTTWHSVGSVGQVRGSRLLTLLSSRTAQMLPELERETGMATGYKRYGSIGLALNAERLEEFRRTASIAKAWGHEAAILTPGEIKERYPQVEVGDVLGGLYLPGDGRTNPVDTVQALAKACRLRGARIFEATKVEGIVVEEGVVRGVRTSRGEIVAEKVLLCAGMWSREIAESIGVHIPLLAAEHFYAVTEPIPGLPRDTPMVRVPDERTYYKEDAGKLLFGCLEEVAKPWGMRGIPESFCFDSLPEDLEHFGPILETAMVRMPMLKDAGIKLFFNGPESFTPDGNFYLGETAEARNLFVSCGFNTIGVMASGGIGLMAAQLIARGRADWDVSSFDVKRAARFETNVSYLAERITEGLGKLYGLQCPDQPYESARGVRRSPLHDRHLARNAVMEHVAGWERPAVFAPAGVEPRFAATYGRQAWHDWCASECNIASGSAAVLDNCALAKIAIVGPDALEAVAGLATIVPTVEEAAVRSLILSPAGKLEAIVQIVRIAPDRVLVIGPAGDEVRLESLVAGRLPAGLRAIAVDMTSAFVILDLLGAGVARHLGLAGLRRRGAPAGNAAAIDLGLADGHMVQGGEHGLECTRLILSTDKAAHIHDRLVDAGFAPIGALALKALRIERGIAGWGTEIDATMTPHEAGLATLAGNTAGEGPCVLAHVALDQAGPLLHGREPLRHAGAVIGWMLSGSFGLDCRGSCGLAFLSDPSIDRAAVQVEIAGVSHRAQLQRLPLG